MHKRVLLVETSETIRGVAEPVLRQNGMEVYSVPTAERALQVMRYSRPNLLIVNSRILYNEQTPFYQFVHSDSSLASVPMLVIADSGRASLPLPPEIVVGLPFDPKSFVEQVLFFTGQAESAVSDSADEPLSGADFSDTDLDRALGLDRIEVTDSEVMDKTAVGRRALRTVSEDGSGNGDSGLDDSERIGTIMVTEDQSEIGVKKQKPAGTPSKPSESAALDILSNADQYAMSDPNGMSLDNAERDHDYDWFIKEMQKDQRHGPAEPSVPSEQVPADPLPEATSEPAEESPPVAPLDRTADHSGSVARFIDEFKKEVEKFREGEPEIVNIQEPAAPETPSQQPPVQWEESLETVAPESVDLIAREVASGLADRIAKQIVDRLDSENLIRLIHDEISARLAAKPKN